MAQDFQPVGLTANLTDAGCQVGPNQMITVGPEQVITLKLMDNPEVIASRFTFNLPRRPRTCAVITDIHSSELNSPFWSRPVVVYMNELNVSAVIDAMEMGAVAVISSSGSPFAHGVNLLRAQLRLRGYCPALYGGINCEIINGAQVEIQPDGTIVANVMDVVKSNLSDGPIDYSLREVGSGSRLGRCYWPHRRYDVLTASTMIPGLEQDASRLARNEVTIERKGSGYLWFSSNSLSIAEMSTLARDPEILNLAVNQQVSVYTETLELIGHLRSINDRPQNNLHAIAQSFDGYFGNFLIFHNTYEQLLTSLCSSIPLGELSVEKAFELVLNCQLNDWMVEAKLNVANRKDLLEHGSPLPLAPFTPFKDLEQRRSSIASMTEGLSESTRILLQNASDVFVTKEWKFYANKVLMREFSFYLRQCATWTEDTLRGMSIREVLEASP